MSIRSKLKNRAVVVLESLRDETLTEDVSASKARSMWEYRSRTTPWWTGMVVVLESLRDDTLTEDASAHPFLIAAF